MKKITDKYGARFPYEDLEKVADLLYYDGPILTHFTSNDSNEFLYYWVDSGSVANRWMVINITDIELRRFIEGDTPFVKIIQNNLLSGIYLLDIDDDLSTIESYFILKSQFSLVEEYLPEPSYYFTAEVPEVYTEKVLDKSHYLEGLMPGANFFRFMSTDPLYGKTLGLDDVNIFVSNIYNSLRAYTKYEFQNKFRNLFPTDEKFLKALKEFMSYANPRVVELEFKSFGIGIAEDNLMMVSEIEGVKKFSKEYIDHYEKDILQTDYSESDLKELERKFDDKQRSEIFNPLFRIIENSGYKLEVTNKHFKQGREVKRVAKSTRKRLIPQEQKDELVPVMKLVNMLVEVPKDGDIAKVKSNSLKSGLLFAEEVSSFKLSLQKLEDNFYLASLEEPIELEVSYKDGSYTVNYPPLGLSGIVENKSLIETRISSLVFQLVLSPDEDENEEMQAAINDFKKNINNVEQKNNVK